MDDPGTIRRRGNRCNASMRSTPVVLEESASCPMTFLESQHTDRHEEESGANRRPRGRNVIRSDGSRTTGRVDLQWPAVSN